MRPKPIPKLPKAKAEPVEVEPNEIVAPPKPRHVKNPMLVEIDEDLALIDMLRMD